MNTIDEGITELEDKSKGILPVYKSRAKKEQQQKNRIEKS